MTPFNNELQVGQPAMIINVEQPKFSDQIGKTVIVLALMSSEESKQFFFFSEFKPSSQPYAVIDDGTDYGRNGQIAILQKFLMPLPPLGDVYDEEIMEVGGKLETV